MQLEHAIASAVEQVVRPLLNLLDRSGLFQTLRFAPLYRLVAALSALVLIAYVGALATRALTRRVDHLRGVRVVGRLVSLGLAVLLTAAVFSDASFVLARSGDGPAVVRSNLGFFLILALVLFLEIRFARWNGPR
jgi:hypothetical protein